MCGPWVVQCAVVAGTHASQLVQVGAILEVAGGALAAAAQRVERDQAALRDTRHALSRRLQALEDSVAAMTAGAGGGAGEGAGVGAGAGAVAVAGAVAGRGGGRRSDGWEKPAAGAVSGGARSAGAVSGVRRAAGGSPAAADGKRRRPRGSSLRAAMAGGV